MVNSNLVILDEKFQIIAGYLYGLRYPSLIIHINKPSPDLKQDLIKKILSTLFPNLNFDSHDGDNPKDILDVITLCIFKLQNMANWGIFEESKIIEEDKSYSIAIPVIKYGHQYQWIAIQNLIAYLNACIRNENIDIPLNKLINIISRMKSIGVKRENVLLFLKAAFNEGIPFLRFADRVYQFGYGSLSKIQDSSFTEETAQISAGLARNKSLTLEILANAGIPTPTHSKINSIDDAIKFANDFGFPIVIKPDDQDGGNGVTVDINNEAEITLAFNKALKFSKNIVAENYITGNDYRLVVFRGKLIWAVHRMPAHVKGDGISSIKDLVAIENNKSTRNNKNLSAMKPLELTDESLSMLTKQGVNQDSVLKIDEIIYLKKEGNISSGGTPVSAFDNVHKDNEILAIRAAEALRLDLAGIDLLMPDISKSWRELGGAICEVNAQPMLGSITSSHLYKKIINELILNKGKPPTILIINLDHKNYFIKSLRNELQKLNLRVCEITPDNIFNDSFKIKKEASKEMASVTDRNIDAFVMEINNENDIKDGIAFQYINNIVILTGEKDSKNIFNALNIKLLNKVLPMCDNSLFLTSKLNKEFESQLLINKNVKIIDAINEEQCLTYIKENLESK